MNMALPDACTNLYSKELLLTLNEGQMAADEAHITHDMQLTADALPEENPSTEIDSKRESAHPSFNFSALTAFSEDDPEAARSIIGLLSKRPERMPNGCSRHWLTGGGRNCRHGS